MLRMSSNSCWHVSAERESVTAQQRMTMSTLMTATRLNLIWSETVAAGLTAFAWRSPLRADANLCVKLFEKADLIHRRLR